MPSLPSRTVDGLADHHRAVLLLLDGRGDRLARDVLGAGADLGDHDLGAVGQLGAARGPHDVGAVDVGADLLQQLAHGRGRDVVPLGLVVGDLEQDRLGRGQLERHAGPVDVGAAADRERGAADADAELVERARRRWSRWSRGSSRCRRCSARSGRPRRTAIREPSLIGVSTPGTTESCSVGLDALARQHVADVVAEGAHLGLLAVDRQGDGAAERRRTRLPTRRARRRWRRRGRRAEACCGSDERGRGACLWRARCSDDRLFPSHGWRRRPRTTVRGRDAAPPRAHTGSNVPLPANSPRP